MSKVCHPAAVSAFQFKWISSGMKYLGIRLSAEPLFQKIKNDLDKWKSINLTLWGKINAIKMVVAPKFNYISMTIPVIISTGIFKQYNQIIKDYLWNGKKP